MAFVSHARVYKHDLDLYFLGWRSTTYALQRHGWQIAENHSYIDNTMRLLIKHPKRRIVGISNRVSHSLVIQSAIDPSGSYDRILFKVQIAREVRVDEHILHDDYATPVDATPYMLTVPYNDLGDLYYATYFKPIEGGQDILLKKASIEEIMQMALDKQEPAQAEIRARQKLEAERQEYKIGGETKAKLILVA